MTPADALTLTLICSAVAFGAWRIVVWLADTFQGALEDLTRFEER